MNGAGDDIPSGASFDTRIEKKRIGAGKKRSGSREHRQGGIYEGRRLGVGRELKCLFVLSPWNDCGRNMVEEREFLFFRACRPILILSL
jgi:hypothetical protein